MSNVKSAFSVFLVATLGLACGNQGLTSQGLGEGGRSGTGASGGVLGQGGSDSGGTSPGGAGDGGSYRGSGGNAVGGTVSSGGSVSSGGNGGLNTGGSASTNTGASATGGRGVANTGGSMAGGRTGANSGGNAVAGTSGTGGSTCPSIECLIPNCPGGTMPNPNNPCGCPICAPTPPDAGGGGAPDTGCLSGPCPFLPACQAGYQYVTPPCGCPTCVPVDAGQPDAIVCQPVVCPAIMCVGGTMPNPDNPCGCPICAHLDASSGTGGQAGAATGGSSGTGGQAGAAATGGSSSGGGGGSCSNVTPCGGDVVGTRNVASSCLILSGDMDVTLAGLGCSTVPVTGSLQVTGTWTANANGTYRDNTTTTGSITFPLDDSCLTISSVKVECSKISVVFTALGWATSTCSIGASGKCYCSAAADQSGGIGVISPWASNSGTYNTSGSGLHVDDSVEYSYCVSGNTLTLTPKPTILPVTGTVVLQKVATATGGTKAQ